MEKIRRHFSRRRRSSSAASSPTIASTDRHKDRDSSPRRLYVTSDTYDFDQSVIARFQEEGFEVEYLPFLGGEDVERDRKDLVNLLYEREDDLEPGERYAVVAFHRPAFLLVTSHHQSTTASFLPRLCALIAYYPHEPLTCAEDSSNLLPPSTISTSTSTTTTTSPSLSIQIHLAGHQNPSFWNEYTTHPDQPPHRCHLYFYPESRPGFAELPSPVYDRVSSRLAWSRALDGLKHAFGWPGGHWETPDVEMVWSEYWRKLCGSHAGSMGEDEGLDEMPVVNCVPTLVGTDESAIPFHTSFHTGPPSQHIRLLSRTIGVDRVVDEILLVFRHSEEIPWLLPGVPPTDREVKVVLVMTASFRAGKLVRLNVYWDQASVLVQIGLLDPVCVPGGFCALGKTRDGREVVERLPVVGVEGVEKVLSG